MENIGATIIAFETWIRVNGFKRKFIANKIGLTAGGLYQILAGRYLPSKPVINMMLHLMNDWNPTEEEEDQYMFTGYKAVKREKVLSRLKRI